MTSQISYHIALTVELPRRTIKPINQQYFRTDKHNFCTDYSLDSRFRIILFNVLYLKKKVWINRSQLTIDVFFTHWHRAQHWLVVATQTILLRRVDRVSRSRRRTTWDDNKMHTDSFYEPMALKRTEKSTQNAYPKVLFVRDKKNTCDYYEGFCFSGTFLLLLHNKKLSSMVHRFGHFPICRLI